MSCKFSIIIPVYNVADYLDECLNSVLNQSFRDLELICIDDGSSDTSRLILDKYQKQDKRVNVIVNEQNIGLGATRNKGIMCATGEYILFLDGDDIMAKDLCLKISSVVNKYPNIDICTFNFKQLQTSGNLSVCSWCPQGDSRFVSIKDFDFLYATAVWARAFRREFILSLQLFNTEKASPGEDIGFTIPAFMKAHTTYFLNYDGVYWRVRNGSNSRVLLSFHKSIKNDIRVFRYLKRELQRLNVFSENKFLVLQLRILSWELDKRSNESIFHYLKLLYLYRKLIGTKILFNNDFKEMHVLHLSKWYKRYFLRNFLIVVLSEIRHKITKIIKSTFSTTNIPNYWQKKLNKAKHYDKNKTFITYKKAYKKGYTDVYFSWRGIGDQILLLGAATVYAKKTGKKLLLLVDEPEIFANCPYCLVLQDVSPHIIWESLSPNTSSSLQLSKMKFNLHFLNSAYYDAQAKLHFPLVPMQATLCSQLGLTGKIDCQPKLYLSKQEKFKFTGKKKLICVMSGGNVPYKTLPLNTIQETVSLLKKDFHFIQIGGPSDTPIAGVEYQCGLSIRQSAAILKEAYAFIGTIGGLMHLAEAVNCPAIIAWGAEPEIYGGYNNHVHIFSTTPCDLCPKDMLNPLFDSCPKEYKCIRGVKAQDLVTAVLRKEFLKIKDKKTTYIITRAKKTKGLESLYQYLMAAPAIRNRF